MYGIRYSTSEEFARLSRETPQATNAYFNISKMVGKKARRKAIRDAQAQWNTEEVQDNLQKQKLEFEIAKIIWIHPKKKQNYFG